MATLTIELPSQVSQQAFNLRRWEELLRSHPELEKIEGRIETDRYGYIVMSPLPAAQHSGYQCRIAVLLSQAMISGRISTECPISTADGVKGADVAWASSDCLRELGSKACYPRSPEICIEVPSPSNTRSEIQEKMRLYFDAGAKETWLCSGSGAMTFYAPDLSILPKSELCPTFPKKITLA
jgi:Uma2 family endonuclease